MSRRKYKTSTHEGTIKESLDCGDVLEDLQTQMGEWQENLEGNNMEHLPKYDEVQEAAEGLEQANDSIQEAANDLAEALEKAGAEHILAETVSYMLMTPYKGRSEPRWMQRDNAIAALQAVAEHLDDGDSLIKLSADGSIVMRKQSESEETPVLYTDNDDPHGIEDHRSTLSDSLEEASGIDFPGMFG